MTDEAEKIVCGDCLDVMRDLPDACVDAIVTDPPYGLSSGPTKYLGDEDVRVGGFMGKSWDHGVPGPAFWIEALRVAKPGAHLVAFGGTRTYHRLACAIEDAGWEIRDCFSWLYGSGFPKNLDVSRAIDKAAGAEREVIGTRKLTGNAAQSTKEKGGTYASNTNSVGVAPIEVPITAPATDAARQWQGWGTALKPAWEPIILARKPLVGTVAANVLAHGTGALNIDGCRIGTGEDKTSGGCAGVSALHEGGITKRAPVDFSTGRWPANVALDEEAAAMLDEQTGERPSTLTGRAEAGRRHDLPRQHKREQTGFLDGVPAGRVYADSGGASRFFYTAKASRAERTMRGAVDNKHPTVKPVSLMRWLVRLVTPPQGSVLDPFAGSGTTLLAAHLEGLDYLGIEREAEYVEIIRERLRHVETLRDSTDPGRRRGKSEKGSDEGEETT